MGVKLTQEIAKKKIEQKFNIKITATDLDFIELWKIRAFTYTLLKYEPNTSIIKILDIHRQYVSLGKAVTLKRMVLKYGEKEGSRRFESYRQKQAYTNSLEYKQKKYGMSKEEFDMFNKSRSVTLENLQKKHGLEIGKIKYDSYCAKQAYTNTKAHLGEKYEAVNKQKSHNIENYKRLYGEETAVERLENFFSSKNSKGYSKISQKFFFELYEKFFRTYKCNFAEHNKEYVVFDSDNNRVYKYDFVCFECKFCIEFNGDLYHANPKKYLPSDIPKFRGNKTLTAKDIWEADRKKSLCLEKNRGIKLITVWESDYRDDPKKVFDRIELWIKHNIPMILKS